MHFLNITFNLTNSTCFLYWEPNDEPMYINSRANHPKSINRLSQLSWSEETLQTESAPYEEPLTCSKYNHALTYMDDNPRSSQWRNHHRSIIWFNPPFSKNVKTIIGRKFIALIGKHFPEGHPLHRIFNHNTVKISYSCMPNIRTEINKHNAQAMRKNITQLPNDNAACNCRTKSMPTRWPVPHAMCRL